MRKLIVGRDISLSGEIAACDVLVVEGTVEARLRDGRNIEISETGLFKGSVEIDEADIAGRFEGEITVRGRLKVRAGGRIQGSIRYGELEVEAGGQLSGDIQVIGAQPARAGVRPTPAPVREPAPMAEEPRAAAGIEA
jgi:cytoskeletal protein CcmA (bactofilin family)